MPQRIRQDKVLRIKNRLLQGMSKKKAMMLEGYAENTARHCGRNKGLFKEVCKEIKKECKKLSITSEFILDGMANEAKNAEKSSDRIAALAWLGKNQKLWVDVSEERGNPSKLIIINSDREYVNNQTKVCSDTEPLKLPQDTTTQ